MNRKALSIVHFSTSDSVGGSARSAYRIHGGLRARGHRSRMLVGWRGTDDPDVDTVHAGPAGRTADRIANRLGGMLGMQYVYLPSGHRVTRHPWVRSGDVIQLYNTHGGYFSHRLLPALSRYAPVVWRLSDMWAATGHCSYPGSCERWRTGCGHCPDLGSYPSLSIDTTALLFRLKDKSYARSNVTVVAPSSWTERVARESPLLGRFEIVRIPNGLDREIYRPRAQGEARLALGIDPTRKVILFAAHILDNNERKGSELLVEALNRIGADEDVLLVLMGEGGKSFPGRVPVEVTLLGSVREPERIALAYAAADIVALPSTVENLPNVLIEALACGIPVVAFAVGGMQDGVDHMETGYLARPGDVADFAAGLRLLLGDTARRREMSEKARALFEREFTAEVETDRFEDLYYRLRECAA